MSLPQNVRDHLEAVEAAHFDHRTPGPDEPLFHYTDADAFTKIVDSKTLWATHYAYQNDATEMNIGEEEVQAVADELVRELAGKTAGSIIQAFEKAHQYSGLRLSHVTDVYVTAFSEGEAGNTLSQWRAYGSNGCGFSLGFADFDLPPDNEGTQPLAVGLFKCIYSQTEFMNEARQRLRDMVEDLGNRLDHHDPAFTSEVLELTSNLLARRVADLVPRRKHAGFKDECEWRLVVTPMRRLAEVIKYRSKPFRGLVPYVVVPFEDEHATDPAESVIAPIKAKIVKVYVGPTQDPLRGAHAAGMFMLSRGYGMGIVEQSSIPYRG